MKKQHKQIKTIALFVIALFAGLTIGVAVFTFHYAEGGSYFENDPRACMNCHAMRDHFDRWNQSSHRNVATCNDCHAPQGLIGKLAVKAANGFAHSWAFTMDNYHEPIAIKPWNKSIAANACLNCHADFLNENLRHAEAPGQSCLQCHQQVGHTP